ncbi:DUF3099 domain-containing protein [Actinocorallia sp. B10E7]|uniref:DUF3099 domain-containing protein n=1 Tax=Actinocorallia sp. B10E7 TaxID=3153558 RepID=UPI00325F1505
MEPRKRRYLIMMGTCLTLYVLAGAVVRFWSTPLAVAMAVVASVIPPVAVILANRPGDEDGAEGRGHDDLG